MENNNTKLIMGILIGAIVSATLALAAILLFAGRANTGVPAPVAASEAPAPTAAPAETAAEDSTAELMFLVDGEVAVPGDDGAYHIKLDKARAAQSLAFSLSRLQADTAVTYSAAFADSNIPLTVEVVSQDGMLNAWNIMGDGKFIITAREESADSAVEETSAILTVEYPVHVTGVFYNGEEITGDTALLNGEQHVFTWSAVADGTVTYSYGLYETGAQEPLQTAEGLTEGLFEIGDDMLSYGNGYELRFAASVTGEDGQNYEAQPAVIIPELDFGLLD